MLVGGYLVNIRLLVTFEAKLRWFFKQKLGIVRNMRLMAGNAFSIASGVMLKAGSSHALLEVLVAFETKISARLGEQFLVVRLVRRVACSAFTVLHWLMFDLRLG